MVIVSTSEQNVNCFVETKNLDGETNLKVKRGLEEYSYMRTSVDCANMKCLIEMEAPTVHMYTFNGVATVFKNGEIF